jgi:hypothetical protein
MVTKWFVSGIMLAAGLAAVVRGGDDSPIGTIMGQIHLLDRSITKRLRAPAALDVAGRGRLTADAASLVRLGKEVRSLERPAQARKRPRQDWERAVNQFLTAGQSFARVIANEAIDQPRTIKSYQKLQRTCTNCHTLFRDEAD